MLNIKVVTWSLAVWTAFTYIFCVLWGVLSPHSPHMYLMLELARFQMANRLWLLRGFN